MNFNQKRSTLSAGLRLFHPRAVLTARVLLTLAVGLRPFPSSRRAHSSRPSDARCGASPFPSSRRAHSSRPSDARCGASPFPSSRRAHSSRPSDARCGASPYTIKNRGILGCKHPGIPLFLIVHGSTFSYLQTGCISEAIPARWYRSGRFSVWL